VCYCQAFTEILTIPFSRDRLWAGGLSWLMRFSWCLVTDWYFVTVWCLIVDWRLTTGCSLVTDWILVVMSRLVLAIRYGWLGRQRNVWLRGLRWLMRFVWYPIADWGLTVLGRTFTTRDGWFGWQRSV
jgi:hypothetical protein